MVVVPLAGVWALVCVTTLGLLWACRALAPRLAEGRDYSVLRHLLWVLPASFAAVAMLAATSVWVFLPIALVVTALLFFRASLDAQDADRQSIAFAELFAGYFSVAWGLMLVRGDTDGLAASAPFAHLLRDAVTHLALPAQWLAFGPSSEVAAWAAPELVAVRVADSLAQNLAAASATSSFLLAWFSLAYLSPRLLPDPGLPLVPVPRVASLLFLVSFFAERLAGGVAATVGSWGVALLWPAVAAEGIAMIRAAGSRFRSRRILSVLLVLLLPLLPRLWGFLAFVGLLSSALSLRALVPPLRAGDGTAWHPTLSLGVRAGVLVFVLAGALGASDAVVSVAASPLVGAPPATCAKVQMAPKGDVVSFESPWATFRIDAMDTEVPLERASQQCESRGARLCTSDEWYLACLCTYPAESEAGPQLTGNELLAHRVRTEAPAGPGQPRLDEKRHVRRLLEGPQEVVVGAGGQALFAGGTGPDGSSWMTDCRHRGLVAPGVGSVGLRCCR